MEIPELNSFRLVGGTALALQKGHRTSIDVGLFSDAQFDNEHILRALEACLFPERPFNVRTYGFGFFCNLCQIKTDFMFWGDSFIEPPLIDGIVRMATPLEIFAMKLHAIASRKTKKDFIDIALLLPEISLKEALAAYQKKYPYDDFITVLKQLSYFEEAEKTAEPQLLLEPSWGDAKSIIAAAIRKYWQDEL